jgi:hypothetical protein
VLTWIQGFWTAYKDTWVLFAKWLLGLFKPILRFWKIGFAIVAVIITMTKASLLFAFQMASGLLMTIEGTFEGVQGIQQGAAFSGAPWSGSMSLINAFVPVTEILAATVALWGIWLVAVGVKFGIFVIDRFKFWVAQWI